MNKTNEVGFTMDTFGRHSLAELWGCDVKKIDDFEYIKQLFQDAAVFAGAEVKQVAFQKFEPQGISGVVIISESHLTIHSFPEHGYASIDVYTCGHRMDPDVAVDYIIEHLEAKKVSRALINRGIEPKMEYNGVSGKLEMSEVSTKEYETV